jgi:hypothetical protein
MRALEREVIASVIEHLIDLLDRLEGDPDLEDSDPAEDDGSAEMEESEWDENPLTLNRKAG